jgi:hypothetical protein
MARFRAARAFALAAAAAAGLAVSPAPARSAQPDAGVDAILRSSRAALGLDALGSLRTLHFRGKSVFAGVSGTADVWQDLRDGRFAQFADAGPLSGAQGYDGSAAWNRDASGVVWNDGAAPARYAAEQAAYQNAYLLWQPGRGGADVALRPERTANGKRYDVLRVTPPSTPPFDLWIDAATHLPGRVASTIGGVASSTTYADYRDVDGLMVPFVQNGSAAFGATTVVANDAAAEAALRRPAMHVDDFSLPSGATTIPFELVDNHVDLPVTINGKGPFRFIFDTGGSNLIDSALAKELGIETQGHANGSGVGAATEPIRFGTAARLQVGDATLRNQVFVVASVRDGFGRSSGKPVDGLIGFEVLSRFVTTFDYAKNEIVLRAPGSAPPAGGTTIPCAIDASAGRCTVDTGSRTELTAYSPFLAAHPSIVPPNAAAIGENGFGIGGAALGRLGRTTLQVGSFTIPDVITDLSTQTRGAFADPFIAGNVGAGTWKRFAVTFDYAKQTMTLAPNANYGARETYDRSGTFLIVRDGKIVVADVRPGTAAADAGLAKGDVLTAVDDKDPAGMGLAAIRTLFRGPAGTVITLAFTAKDGSAKTAALRLRDYV